MNPPAHSWTLFKSKLALWLKEGISPRRLALTLALGFALGCLPVIGIPTGLCLLVALVFRLNVPAIQAANYAAMPFQLALIVPFVRLGGKLIPSLAQPAMQSGVLAQSPVMLAFRSPSQFVSQMGMLAGQALLAWVLISIPVVILLTVMLTGVLRRVPALAAAETGD